MQDPILKFTRGEIPTWRYTGFPGDSVQLFNMANWGLVLPMNFTLCRQPHLSSSPASVNAVVAGSGQRAESAEGWEWRGQTPMEQTFALFLPNGRCNTQVMLRMCWWQTYRPSWALVPVSSVVWHISCKGIFLTPLFHDTNYQSSTWRSIISRWFFTLKIFPVY